MDDIPASQEYGLFDAAHFFSSFILVFFWDNLSIVSLSTCKRVGFLSPFVNGDIFL